ncbi:MAG: hypothetical protein H6732_09405 [Alphaproteobacteria bacterium]|nr:hypothetical protein [Alphaproteobacteria bacterium]
MRSWIAGGLLAACAVPGTGKDVVDTHSGDTVPAEDCPVPAQPALEFDIELGDHGMVDGAEVPYGTPPQGGAPYTPFQLRVKAALEVTQRVDVTVRVTEEGTGTLLGEVVQPQAFFCANTGVHQGWRYGGEVHARYSGWRLPDLEGRAVEVTVEVPTPAGPARASARGVLHWALGPGVPGGDTDTGIDTDTDTDGGA